MAEVCPAGMMKLEGSAYSAAPAVLPTPEATLSAMATPPTSAGLSKVAVMVTVPPSRTLPVACWTPPAPARSDTVVGASSLSMVITAWRLPEGRRT